MPGHYSPDCSTYAISLCFDDSSGEKILSLQNKIASVTGNDFLTKNQVPPHITIGMFHASDEDLPKLRASFEDFFNSVGHSFALDFSGTDSFLEKVLFLSPNTDSPGFLRLKELNSELHEKLSAFEPGGNRNYLPERFFPHVTLAVKLKKEEFAKGITFLGDAQGIVGARSVAEIESCEIGAMERKRNPEKPGLPLGRCAQIPENIKIVAVSLAKCKPYSEICHILLSQDILSAEQRHKNMSAIKSTGGKLEVALRSQLFKFGFRFRKNDKRLTGSPDIVFPHYRAVIFVNGCFWHSHGWRSSESLIKSPLLDENVLFSLSCKKFRMPTANPEFWLKKFTKNRERDLRDVEKLLLDGWRVGVLWECSITGRGRREKIRSVAEKISLWLEEGQTELFREF